MEFYLCVKTGRTFISKAKYPTMEAARQAMSAMLIANALFYEAKFEAGAYILTPKNGGGEKLRVYMKTVNEK